MTSDHTLQLIFEKKDRFFSCHLTSSEKTEYDKRKN